MISLMYTTEQYEAEYRRFANAPREELVLVKKAFTLKAFTTEKEQARLAAAKVLLVERQKVDAAERSKTRYVIRKIDQKRASR